MRHRPFQAKGGVVPKASGSAQVTHLPVPKPHAN